jgi:predicted nucleic acid-binding Zn ribbon protein
MDKAQSGEDLEFCEACIEIIEKAGRRARTKRLSFENAVSMITTAIGGYLLADKVGRIIGPFFRVADRR